MDACKMCGKAAEFVVTTEFENAEHKSFGCKDHYSSILADLMSKQGHKFKASNSVNPLTEEMVKAEEPEVAIVVAEPVKEEPKRDENISDTGKLRSVINDAISRAAGFSLQPTLFAIGTKVNSTGVENFKRSRAKYEALPSAEEAIEDLISKVEKEDRREKIISTRDLIMLPNGELSRIYDGKPIVNGYPMNRRALVQLLNYTGASAGGAYLEGCPTALRAHNVNWWLRNLPSEKKSKIRIRKINTTIQNIPIELDEIFAILTESYTNFDIDDVAKIVLQTIPTDAKAEVTYDGLKSRIYVLFHSDVDANDIVCGETFKVGVMIKTDDAGGGSIQVKAVVWRNLCLNLIVIDKAVQRIVRRKHIGDFGEIHETVQAGIATAYKCIEPFARAWTSAKQENLITSTVDIENEDSKSPRYSLATELFMAGLMNGMIERELITVTGNKKEAVNNLVAAWEKEPELTRAGVVNAVTRYAHEFGQSSPWQEDDLQEQGGDILFSNKPLPWKQVQQ